MREINTSDKRFHNGNGRNEMGTVVTAEWLNAVQDELVNIVTALGGHIDEKIPNQIATLLLAKLGEKSALVSPNFTAHQLHRQHYHRLMISKSPRQHL